MTKPKISFKPVSNDELDKFLSPKRKAKMLEDVKNIQFGSKRDMEIFSGTYSSVPVPLHLLRKKFSKEDAHAVAQLVALVVNEIEGRCARTAQFIHKMPKNNPHVKMIIKNSKYVSKKGKGHRKLLDNLWKRKEKLKKHELFRLWLEA